MTKRREDFSTRLKKYIPYAIGEIFLVVIGILIAFQLRNWNENNKNIALAHEYLENISSELKIDTTVFNQTIKRIEQIMEIKKLVLNSNQIDTFPVEYLDYASTTQYMNTKINDATFSRMNNPDILNMPKFQKIFKRVNRYYTYSQDYLTNFNDWEVTLSRKEVEFWEEQGDFEISLLFYSKDSIPMHQEPSLRKKKIIEKINSIKGRNFLKLSLFRFISIKKLYTQTKNAAVKLLEDIKNKNDESTYESADRKISD